MSKRKKLRTSGEGLHPPKPPKNPRLGRSNGGLHSSHPEEPEDNSEPATFTELSREEAGGAVCSSPHEETGVAPRLLRQPEEEPLPLPPSQNSVGRFVPQFAKPRKTGTRKAETGEEDPGHGAVSSEAPPEPRAQQVGGLLLQEPPRLALQETRGPGEQTQADRAHSEQRGQGLATPVPASGDSQPLFCPEGSMGPSHSDRASQDPLVEQRSNVLDSGKLESSGPEAERPWVLGDLGQKGSLPSSDAEEKEPDSGAPQEGGAQGGEGPELPQVPTEEGASSPSTPAPAPALGLAQALSPATPRLDTRGVAQDLPDPRQIAGGTDAEAEQSCGRPGSTSLRAVVIADMGTHPLERGQRAPEVTRPDRQADLGPPASPGRQAPGRGHRGAPLDCVPPAEETSTGRGGLGPEDDPQCDMPLSLLAFLAPASRNQESTVDAEDSGHLALEMGPDVSQRQGPGPVPEGPGRVCTQPGRQAVGLGSQGSEQVPKVLGLSLRASGLLELRDTVDDPPQETRAALGSPDTSADPAGQAQQPPTSSGQAAWRESSEVGLSDVGLDFLPDSQIQDALDVPDLGAPPEQLSAGSKSGLCWPDPSPRARGDLVAAEVQPRPGVGGQAQEACRMADATGTVRGLVVELSNLNRLIMSTHRDLEALKRLNSRKAKPPGKNPLLYPSRGAGSLSRGEQAWRDL